MNKASKAKMKPNFAINFFRKNFVFFRETENNFFREKCEIFEKRFFLFAANLSSK